MTVPAQEGKPGKCTTRDNRMACQAFCKGSPRQVRHFRLRRVNAFCRDPALPLPPSLQCKRRAVLSLLLDREGDFRGAPRTCSVPGSQECCQVCEKRHQDCETRWAEARIMAKWGRGHASTQRAGRGLGRGGPSQGCGCAPGGKGPAYLCRVHGAPANPTQVGQRLPADRALPRGPPSPPRFSAHLISRTIKDAIAGEMKGELQDALAALGCQQIVCRDFREHGSFPARSIPSLSRRRVRHGGGIENGQASVVRASDRGMSRIADPSLPLPDDAALDPALAIIGLFSAPALLLDGHESRA